MAKADEPRRLAWPWWATLALLAVVAMSAATIVVTIYTTH